VSATSNGASATPAGEFTLGGDLTVRRLGFGAMRITGAGIWGDPPEREGAIAVLRRTVELDVNLIDTADSYGPEVSENLIAEALYPYPNDLVIATKGGLTRDGPGSWHRDGSPQHLREACEGSLRRLRVDRIDLYQLHAVDPRIPYEESVGTLKELRDEGKIRHVGVCNVGIDELGRARAIVPVASVQNRYSLTTRDSEHVLEACESDGLGFIPWFPLDAGQGPGVAVEEVARRHRATARQVALAWLLHQSPVMLPIPGTSSIEHLEENVAAASLELTEEDMATLEAAARR
jgi:aryl-alcohol dehydrogenase-like predicted oxidoreductase